MNLNLKSEIDRIPDQSTYSIVLRGARDHKGDTTLEIFTPMFQDPCRGILVSQRHFRFMDLADSDCHDNYSFKARTYMGLNNVMLEAYPDFDSREIVTLLKFKI